MKAHATTRISTLACLSAILLAAGWPSHAQGADEAEDAPKEAVLEQAAVKRKAYIIADQLPKEDGVVWGLGVFISRDGLALVNLAPLSFQEKPGVYSIGYREMPFGRVLHVFPEQEVALMKFDHQPEAWVPPAKEEPDVGDAIALIPVKQRKPWEASVPPVVGPVMAKRSSTTPNLRVERFVRVMSLGAGMTPLQKSCLGPGRFAINQDGELVGFTNGTETIQAQTIIEIATLSGIGEKVEETAGSGSSLEFPLSEEDNPMDPATLDKDFHPMNVAFARNNHEEGMKHLQRLRIRYPQSHMLKRKEVHVTAVANPDVALPRLMDDPGPHAPAVHQMKFWYDQSESLAMQGKLQEAIESSKKAIALSPEDHYPNRFRLGHMLAYIGETKEAEAVYRKIHAHGSDIISLVEEYESLLIKMGKIDEADKLADRIYELRDIYRTPLE